MDLVPVHGLAQRMLPFRENTRQMLEPTKPFVRQQQHQLNRPRCEVGNGCPGSCGSQARSPNREKQPHGDQQAMERATGKPPWRGRRRWGLFHRGDGKKLIGRVDAHGRTGWRLENSSPGFHRTNRSPASPPSGRGLALSR